MEKSPLSGHFSLSFNCGTEKKCTKIEMTHIQSHNDCLVIKSYSLMTFSFTSPSWLFMSLLTSSEKIKTTEGTGKLVTILEQETMMT